MPDASFRTALGRTEERWSAQLDRLFDRFEKSVDRLEDKLTIVERQVQSEFEEARIAAGELRDGIALLKDRVGDLESNREANARASAEGAAKGAGEAAGAAAASAAATILAAERPTPFLSTFWGKAVVAGTGVSALAGAVGLIPKIIVVGGAILTFLAGLK